jgi:hypothetical protein
MRFRIRLVPPCFATLNLRLPISGESHSDRSMGHTRVSPRLPIQAVFRVGVQFERYRRRGRSITLLGPEFEERGAFQDKHIPVFRCAQAEQHPF